MEGMSGTLDPKGVGQLGAGLGAAAEYLTRVGPGADEAAGRLEKTTAALTADSKRLSALLKEGPLDLRAARATAESLGKFEDALARLNRVVKLDNFAAMRDGFKGLETALSTGADQVDKLADYTYPVVKVNGLKVNVEQRKFWADGKTVAEGMRKGAKGATAAVKELEAIHKELPQLRASLAQSGKVVSATRQALEAALKQQEKLGPLLKDVPQHAARLAEELPQLGGGLAKLMRDTARLREAGKALRETQQGLDAAVARWPEMRRNLCGSAVILRTMQTQLQSALGQREQYEEALRQTLKRTLELTRLIADALPLLTAQFEEGLSDQERSLAELGDSLDEVSRALPPAADSAARLLQTTRLLLALVAVVVGLHAVHLILGARLGPPYAG
jgi:ABC-type transporter Mla subunit MlaD